MYNLGLFSMSSFYNNFIYQCAKQNVSPSKAAEAVGLSRAAPSGWKNGAIPRDTQISKLADYFGCSVDELIGTSEETSDLDFDGQGNNLDLRETLRRRPEMKILFDTAIDAPTSAIYEAIATIMKSKEGSQ